LVQVMVYGFLLLVTACAPAAPPDTIVPIHVQYSFATQPWLPNVYRCANENIVIAELRAVEFQDLQKISMVIRIGQPGSPTKPAFKIGTDDLLVIANRQNPSNTLTADQVRGLFTGQIQTWKSINGSDTPVQVWVFSAGEDLQQIFEQSVLDGSPIISVARLATSPNEMSQAVSNNVGAIGILNRRWKTGNTLNVFTAVSNLPVLAITQSEPQGNLAQIIACLQK
jgi:hypothetical protein